MSLSDPSVNFQLRTQEATFRVPYELLKKNIKEMQKLDEKQFRKLDELIKEATKINDKEIRKLKLQQIIISVKQYEKKVKVRYDLEEELKARLRARIGKLNELKEIKESINNKDNKLNDEVNRERLINWYRDQTNLLIVDYLLRNNHSSDSNPGLKLIKELQCEKLVDADVILSSNRISNSILQNHDLAPLIAWIQENKSYLKKTKSNLEFQTRFQEYIERVKIGEISQALKIFHSHLHQFTKTNFNEIRLGSGLLMLNETVLSVDNPKFQKYSNLLSDDRYKFLNDLFLEIYNKMYGIPLNDPLLVYLSMGISVLKTKSCKCASSKVEDLNFETLLRKKMEPDQETTNNDIIANNCPVCSLELNNLSEQLPYSHNVKSFLFDNPIKLPNGNIFDQVKLKKFSDTVKDLDEESVMDPITSEVFETKLLVRMFPT